MSSAFYGRGALLKTSKRYTVLELEREIARQSTAYQIIASICKGKQENHRAPVLATWIEVINRYHGDIEILRASIETLARLRLIRKTRTINYEAYII